ncbi:hypothetical protein [Flammeovirga sp. EKP202]|uniref:hypothetical protein n=1 Tax=Flammeovirga sp. EKP202 TaxID=2770592 RepID=UPI00165F12B6|nr:hypothetical protein [Flammeovirga sp. EKP202]MBD0401836.1 hypothetical protein [Flammeovirga sp. EKP202]
MKHIFILGISLLFLFSCNNENDSQPLKHISRIKSFSKETGEFLNAHVVTYQPDFTVQSIKFEDHPFAPQYPSSQEIVNINYNSGQHITEYTFGLKNGEGQHYQEVYNFSVTDDKIIKYSDITTGEIDNEHLFTNDINKPFVKKHFKDNQVFLIDFFEWTDGNITKISRYVPGEEALLDTEAFDQQIDSYRDKDPVNVISIQYDSNPKLATHFEGMDFPQMIYNFDSYKTKNNPQLITNTTYASGIPTLLYTWEYKFNYDEDDYPLNAELSIKYASGLEDYISYEYYYTEN